MTDDKQRKTPVLRFKGFHDDWEQRKLGEIMKVTSVKRIHQSDWQKEGIPFYRARDIVAFSKNQKISEPLYISRNKYEQFSKISGKVKKNDLLVTGVGTIGVPLLIRKTPLYFKDGNIIWFQNNNQINGNFFYNLFLTSSVQKFIRTNTGVGTVSTYTIDSGKRTPVFLPKTKEQNKVSEIFEIIEKLISLQQRKYKILLNLQNTLLMSTLKFKPKVDPVVYFKTSSNKIEKFLLKDVARITMGQSPSSKNYFEKPVGEVLIQGNADIKKNSIYPRIWTTEVTKEVNIGDILLTVRAPVGEVAIADRKAVIGRGVAGISTNNQVIFYYLKLIKNTHIWDRLSSGSTFQSISSKDINNLPLYLPNQETQLKIVKLLNSVLKKISVEENKINTTEELKQFLLQNMFI